MRLDRGMGFALIATLMAVTVPASADVTVGPHLGVFIATADIGKTGTCNNDGTGHVEGGGLSLLPFPVKNLWYTFANGRVEDLPNGPGSLYLCGRLTAPLQDTPFDLKALGIGASCMGHKGWGGYGTIRFPSKPDTWKWLSNVGWKDHAAATSVITADVGGRKGKKQDLFIGLVTDESENAILGCLSKALGDKSDPDPFIVVGEYQIIPGLGGTVPKKEPKKP